MIEYWDLYDINRNSLGRKHERGKPMETGTFHIVVNILSINDDGKILITKRHESKPHGNKWEITGGSVVAGEKSVDGAVRELHEETGITSDNLVEIGRVLHHNHKSFYVEYLCITDIDKDSIVLQEGETSNYKWITADRLLKLSRDELATQRILNFIEELNL